MLCKVGTPICLWTLYAVYVCMITPEVGPIQELYGSPCKYHSILNTPIWREARAKVSNTAHRKPHSGGVHTIQFLWRGRWSHARRSCPYLARKNKKRRNAYIALYLSTQESCAPIDIHYATKHSHGTLCYVIVHRVWTLARTTFNTNFHQQTSITGLTDHNMDTQNGTQKNPPPSPCVLS